MGIRRQHRVHRPAGFTIIELLAGVAIIAILASLILPVLAKARSRARLVQCTSNLRQLHQAMMMYDQDHDRDLENYPDRVTHLYDMGYAPDLRIFICPMDTTKAGADGQSVKLKPGEPVDNKENWAERKFQNTKDDYWADGNRVYKQQNCSYLYEFSGRPCQTFIVDSVGGVWDDNTGFAAAFLVDWDEAGQWWTDPEPMVRHSLQPDDATDIVTWQEAKFWQVAKGDAYTSGFSSPGSDGIPSNWSDEPYYSDWTMDHYPRTWVPILRCFWHCTPELVDEADTRNQGPEEVLNLSLDGTMFYSVPGWEQTAWRYGRTADYQQ